MIFNRKSRPNVILDTESNEVKTLTRQVADSLTPANAASDSSNIEQELLDVLRGHRVISKAARRMERKVESPPEHSAEPQQVDRKKKRIPTTDVEKTTEVFS